MSLLVKMVIAEQYKNCLPPYVGVNGNWWLGETDPGVKAAVIDIEVVTIDYKGRVAITLDGTKCEADIVKATYEHEFAIILTSPTCIE